MAIETGQFLQEQLRTLPTDHPDRELIAGLQVIVSEYNKKSDQAQSHITNTVESHKKKQADIDHVALGRKINTAFIGQLPDETPLSDLTNHFVQKTHTQNNGERTFWPRGPHASQWDQLYAVLNDEERQLATASFARITKRTIRPKTTRRETITKIDPDSHYHSYTYDKTAIETLGQLRDLSQDDLSISLGVSVRKLDLMSIAIQRQPVEEQLTA